jgi:hypothetical protein
MLSQELTDARDTEAHLQRLKSRERVVVRLIHSLVPFMMRLETTDRKDWQGFTRILEVLSLLDEIQQRSPQEIREAIEGFCDLPPNPGQSVSMEEVVFWAGIATGMELRGYVEEGTVDEAVAEKMLIFSSIFAHSMKSAIVDLALGELDPDNRPWKRHESQVG